MSDKKLSSLKEEIADLLDVLKFERDELNLQMHLAKAEAREEWERLEKKWNHFQGKAAQVGDAAVEASKDVGAATHVLGQELKSGYKHIRDALKAEAGS